MLAVVSRSARAPGQSRRHDLVSLPPPPTNSNGEMPVSSTDKIVWISAREALNAVEARFGGSYMAKAELADRLRDGRLTTMAEKKWSSRGELAGTALGDVPDAEDENVDVDIDYEIRPSLWRWSECWTKDQQDWRWHSGSFVLTYDEEELDCILLAGVQFDKAQIDALARGDLNNDGVPDFDDPAPAVRRGRRPEIKARVRVFQKILDLEFKKELVNFKTQEALIAELEDAGLGLRSRALQPLISELWPKLNAHINGA